MIPNAAVPAMKDVLGDKDISHENNDEVMEIKREKGVVRVKTENDPLEVKIPKSYRLYSDYSRWK